MRRLGLIGAAAALALAGCATVGPDYEVPDAAAVRQSAAQGRFLGAGSAPVTSQALPPDWWRLYRDPTLDALIQAAYRDIVIRVRAVNEPPVPA